MGAAGWFGLTAAAVNALHQTIKLVLDAGNFRQAADREKEIAQIYAQDGLDIAKALDSYQRAGDWYKQEDANAYATPYAELTIEPPTSATRTRPS